MRNTLSGILALASFLLLPKIGFPLVVSLTGAEESNQCEAHTYYIAVENPSWATETAENIVIENTVPPDGFVFQNDSAVLATPQGTLFGPWANPAIVSDGLTWDLDALFGVGTEILLRPGQTISLQFNLEVDCDGISGQDDAVVRFDFPYPNQQSDADSMFVTVYPGDINVIKNPVVQPASLGDWVTFTVRVESSGLGSIKNVVVRDTLASGLAFGSANPSPQGGGGPDTYYWTSAEIGALAEMPPDTAVEIALTAQVVSCADIINDADALFGCAGMVSVPDSVCLDTATEVPPGTATATIELVEKHPALSFALDPGMTGIDYCSQTTITVTVTNGYDPAVGPAYGLVLDTNLNATGYDIGNVIGASYNSGNGEFTVGTVPANDTVYFSCDIGWPYGICPPNASSQITLWTPRYTDGCGHPFAPPVAVYPISMTGLPSLSISKNNPGVVNGDDTITFTVEVNYEGPDGFAPTITDDYPAGWDIQSISDGGSDAGGEITWTGLTLNGGDTLQVSFQMAAPGGDPCAGPAPGLYTNTATVSAGIDCLNCLIPGDSASVTFPVEDTPGCDLDNCVASVALSGGGTAEVCTNLSYTVTYTLGTGDLPSDWSSASFRSSMELGQTLASLDEVSVDSFNYQTYVTDNGGAGGTYIVDLSGLDSSPALSPQSATTLQVSYTFTAVDTVGSAWERTDLDLGGGCGVETNWIAVSVERTSVGVSLSGPQIIDSCGVDTYTMSLTKNGYIAYDLLAAFGLDPDGDGNDNYYYLPGSTAFTGTFTDQSGSIAAFEPDTATPGELRWDFAAQGSGSGDLSSVGSIQIGLRSPCAADIHTYYARVEYNDRCDNGTFPRESSASAGPNQPLWVRTPDISLSKRPEKYYATQELATWSINLLNGGDGAAYNVVIIDTLSTNLSYYYGSPVPESVAGKTVTWNFQSLAATWGGLSDLDGEGFINDLLPGGNVGVTLTATVDGCTDMVNRTYAEWGCLTAYCETSNWATSTVYIPPPGLLGVTTFPVAVDLCQNASVYFEVKNTGQTHIYNLCAAQAIPVGANYVGGSSEYRYFNGAVWSSFTGTPNPPCGEYECTDETLATLALNDMDVQIVKEGRNETKDPGGPLSAAPVIADSGDTVYWMVTLSNSGATPAQFVTMTDTLPDTVTYVSANPAPDYQNGQVASWFVGTELPFIATLLATVDGDGCQAVSYNRVDVSWGCQSLGCVSGGKNYLTDLVTEVDFELPGTHTLSDFDTCQGLATFYVHNDGATADNIDFTYTVPQGYYYDASGGGATIESSFSSHTFSPSEEEPFDLGGWPQQLKFAGASRGGNIADGNDYVGAGETLTIYFQVYREPSDFSCDTDPDIDPPPPPPVSGSVVGSYDNTCGVHVTDGITFSAQTVTPDYADLDLGILPATQIVFGGGTTTFNVTLTNNGTTAADNWVVEHTLAAGYSNLASTEGRVIGNTVWFASTDVVGGGAILSTGSRTYTITADVGGGWCVPDPRGRSGRRVRGRGRERHRLPLLLGPDRGLRRQRVLLQGLRLRRHHRRDRLLHPHRRIPEPELHQRLHHRSIADPGAGIPLPHGQPRHLDDQHR
ncbi:MAG: hypothetical protein NTW26_00245 [bacterium]|nr:hypothetical protein [bacterium]